MNCQSGLCTSEVFRSITLGHACWSVDCQLKERDCESQTLVRFIQTTFCAGIKWSTCICIKFPRIFSTHKTTLFLSQILLRHNMAGFKHERRASQLKSHYSHGSRKSTLSAPGPRKSRKPADDEHATVNQTKSRLRNVRRLLENKSNDMTGDQIQNLEREFATLQNDLQELLQRAQYKKLVSKYHKIRFFGQSPSYL